MATQVLPRVVSGAQVTHCVSFTTRPPIDAGLLVRSFGLTFAVAAMFTVMLLAGGCRVRRGVRRFREFVEGNLHGYMVHSVLASRSDAEHLCRGLEQAAQLHQFEESEYEAVKDLLGVPERPDGQWRLNPVAEFRFNLLQFGFGLLLGIVLLPLFGLC